MMGVWHSDGVRDLEEAVGRFVAFRYHDVSQNSDQVPYHQQRLANSSSCLFNNSALHPAHGAHCCASCAKPQLPCRRCCPAFAMSWLKRDRENPISCPRRASTTHANSRCRHRREPVRRLVWDFGTKLQCYVPSQSQQFAADSERTPRPSHCSCCTGRPRAGAKYTQKDLSAHVAAPNDSNNKANKSVHAV